MIKIVPISKFEYRVFPIDNDEPYIEITEEDYLGLDDHSKCFNEDLTAVIDYVPTPEEIAEEEKRQEILMLNYQIGELKNLLNESDYKTLKYLEGELSTEEYEETKKQRNEWRAEINELEAQIKALEEEK